MLFRICLTVVIIGMSSVAWADRHLSQNDKGSDVPLQKMFYYNPVHSVWIEQSADNGAQPMLKVSFKDAVSADYIEKNIYLDIPSQPGQSFPFTALESASQQALQQSDRPLSSAELLRRERMKQHLAKRVWWLKFDQPLPEGKLFALHVRNTSPTSSSPGKTEKNVTLYQFKTLEKSSSGYLQKIFNPTSWQACEETKC
jgi:hypothetical protein